MTTPPAAPPPEQDEAAAPRAADPLEPLHTIADTVGLAPNLRWKDNLIQGLVIAGGALLATLVGLLLYGPVGALFGLLAGLVVSLVASGLVIMVLGWVRTARKMEKKN